MIFTLNDSYVTEEDFCNMYNSEFRDENTSYYTKREWVRAAHYCNDLSKKEGLEPCYENLDDKDGREVITHYERNGYRLPTTEEARMDYAKDNFDENILEDPEWCDNLASGSKTARGIVKLAKLSSWENRTIITDFDESIEKHPFRIGRLKDDNEIILENMPNIGRGLDEPLLVKDHLCLFHLYNGDYALCYKGLGILKNFGPNEPTDIIDFLKEEGFTKA